MDLLDALVGLKFVQFKMIPDDEIWVSEKTFAELRGYCVGNDKQSKKE